METQIECRICMIGGDEESLIQPCRCSTSHVHESCLQKWRNLNTSNEKYIKCEVCKAYYVILRDYPNETFEIITRPTRITCPLFCVYTVYLLLGSTLVYALDMLCGQASLVILNGGNGNDIIKVDNINLSWFIYYLSYTSYIFCMIFFVHILFGVKNHVHRKQFYIKKTRCDFCAYFILSWSYFYNFYIFYKAFNMADLYMFTSLASVPINFFIMKRVSQIHDNTIMELNTNNVETIRSVIYNPLLNIIIPEDEN
uniref:RING-CH-type domain-containing protein n=1 Tax=viral metagenome TaxID=1070528 RepID=A0A6C0EPL7_9ZZZZ